MCKLICWKSLGCWVLVGLAGLPAARADDLGSLLPSQAVLPWLQTAPVAAGAPRTGGLRLVLRGAADDAAGPLTLALTAPAADNGVRQLALIYRGRPQNSWHWRDGSPAIYTSPSRGRAVLIDHRALAAQLFGSSFTLRDILGLDLMTGSYTASRTFVGMHHGVEVSGYTLRPRPHSLGAAAFSRIDMLIDHAHHTVRQLRYYDATGVVSRRLQCFGGSPADPTGVSQGRCALEVETAAGLQVRHISWSPAKPTPQAWRQVAARHHGRHGWLRARPLLAGRR